MSKEVVLLGTAQDGGMPHAGCGCDNCRRARAAPELRARVVSLGVIDRSSARCWLVDATPDFPEQLAALEDTAPSCRLAGILLTHAHIGHYTGLVHLGREVMNAQRIPVYVSRRMADFVRANAPWSQLVEHGNIELRTFVAGERLALAEDLWWRPLGVPHRDEIGDTVAVVVESSRRRLFYCPDIDAWDLWDTDVRAFLEEVDVALLDGTFFCADELPQRDLSQIPHPFVGDTVARLRGSRCDIAFVHLNHSNPLHFPGAALDWLAAPAGDGRRSLRATLVVGMIQRLWAGDDGCRH